MADFKKNKYQISKQVEQINADMGRVPPQAVELEEAVLGAIMLEKGSEIPVMDVLTAEAFYKEAHQKIFKVIIKLSQNYQPIDILTVTEELRKADELNAIGGAFYITQLTSRIASAANIEFHARIIAQKYIQRELIRISSEIQSKAYDVSIDVNDLLDFSERALFEVASGNIKNETARIDAVIKQSIKEIEEAGKRDDGLSGIPCGFTDLDRITSGWQKSDMIVIAARPSMGKTAFVLSMMRNIAVDYNHPVAMFSLEMSNVQLINRLVVGETGLGHDKIKTGRLEDYEWAQLEHKIKDLSEAPIFVDDTPAITLFELRAKCRRLKTQFDIQLVIIDYLQLMSGPPETKGNREQEVSTISRGIKALAKELSVPIMALSQLNRSVEMRGGDKRPQISDLRESGAIEQDADIVMFIHRPERMGILQDEEGNSTKGKAEIIIAKHRNGEVTDINLKFIAEQAKFTDLDYSEITPLEGNDDIPTNITFGSKMNEDNPPAPETQNVDPFKQEDAPF